MVEDRVAPDATTPDDVEFRLGVRSRDPRAWERLHKLFSSSLRRQASWLLPTGTDTENVVSEVWFRALLSVKHYDPTLSPLPWLARICTNLCLNTRRGPRARPTEPLDVELAAPDRSPAEDPDERRRAYQRALANLPKRDREIVTLRYLFSLSTKEIARLLDVADNTVDQALVRGVERLKVGPAAVQLAEWTEAGSIDGMEMVTT